MCVWIRIYIQECTQKKTYRSFNDNLRHHTNSICCISHLHPHTRSKKIPSLKSSLFQPPPFLSGGCLFSFNYLLFSQDHEIKIYTWIPRALVIQFHIFYSEIKQQSNERWKLTPCCSGRAKVGEINFCPVLPGKDGEKGAGNGGEQKGYEYRKASCATWTFQTALFNSWWVSSHISMHTLWNWSLSFW